MGNNYDAKVAKYTANRENYGGDVLRKKLKGQITSKMRTMMIGTIAQIEKYFGVDWGHGLIDDDCSDNQLDKKAIWKRLRDEILDFGNAKIREVEKEVDKYKVENKYPSIREI